MFVSLAEQNQCLSHRERQVADTRIHGTTGQQVGKLSTEMERPALQPLPAERFWCYHEGRRKVNRDGHIEVTKAYYSMPPEYLGRLVWVRWDARLVRVYNDSLHQITGHARALAGKFQTDRSHLADAKISIIERGVDEMLTRASRLGEGAGHWVSRMMAVRGIEGVRVLLG